MKSFKTFLEQRDPELYDELLNEGLRNIAAGILGTAGALAGYAFGGDTSTINKPTIQYVAPHHDKATEYSFNQTYIKNGGPNFISGINTEKELNNAAKKFIEFSKTPQHKEILIKSGILNNKGEPDLTWVPSSFGTKTFYNAVIEMQKERVNEPIVSKPEIKPEVKPETIKYSKWTDDQKDIFIRYAKFKFNVDVEKEKIKTYRPIDLVKKSYGIHADAVIARARKAQEESPNDSSVPLIDKLYDEVPVVFDSPQKFNQSKGTKGFCMTITIGGIRKSICIIDPSAVSDGTLEHELAHAMQKNIKSDNKSYDSNTEYKDPYMTYLLDYAEIGVRVSSMKKQYSEYTGKDPEKLDIVLAHFLTNRDRYTKDVQAIFDMFQNFQDKDKEEDKGEGKDKQKIGNRIRNFSKYLQSNYDKYVKEQQNKPANQLVAEPETKLV
jgi:hypothetical protein